MPSDDTIVSRELLEAVAALAHKAAAEAMALYGKDIQVEKKADSSPVTEADRAVEAVILEGLAALPETVPVVAEEAVSAHGLPEVGERFFLVDPLDGTKEFVNRTGEFTVNIGLIENGQPVLGAVYAPAVSRHYFGAKGLGAFAHELSAEDAFDASDARSISVRTPGAEGVDVVASRSHRSPETDAFLKTLTVRDFKAAGSSLKFCMLAAGEADVYPRLGRTMEWDTAAGQAVLEAAGGVVFEFGSERPLRYGKAERGLDNPHFIAWGAAAARR
ncbi:MAG: 3'(2'),5'-bisphosphate nucleotidase CysQ [Pseudomonadota bacterium]